MRKVAQAELDQRRDEQQAQQQRRERLNQRTNPESLIRMLERLTALTAGRMLKEESLSDDDKAALADLFPQYEAGHDYATGDVFNWHGQLYEVIQSHSSQADWKPDQTPALYKSHTPSGIVPEWVQPTGGHDAYDSGDRVTHNGATWESLLDANVWEPGTDATLWAEV